VRGDAAGADRLLRQLSRTHAAAVPHRLSPCTPGDDRATEDLVHETFRRAARTLHQVDVAPATVRSWLFTLARRVAIEFSRTHQAGPPAADADMALALKRLSPDDRRVIVELFHRGRSVREAAQLLAVPEAEITSRAYHALRALRSEVEATTEAAVEPTPGQAAS
jgi:RNA polymerase sigma-70 factor (ECF subfamily)